MKFSPLYNEILRNLKEGKEYKIAFIGDSITSAESIFPNWRSVFEYILKFSFEEHIDDWRVFEWNLKFFNYSLDSGETKEFLESLKTSLGEINPNLYLIMGTSNDLEQGLEIDVYVKNMRKIFNIVEKEGKDCIYVPSIYGKDEKRNNEYLLLRKEALSFRKYENVQVIDGYEIFKNYDIERMYTLKDEGVLDLEHPNVFGHVCIAKMFLEEAFGIEVNAELFFEEMRKDYIKWPSW
jgi:hypothetical protein